MLAPTGAGLLLKARVQKRQHEAKKRQEKSSPGLK